MLIALRNPALRNLQPDQHSKGLDDRGYRWDHCCTGQALVYQPSNNLGP
jgi:hypothetical protein